MEPVMTADRVPVADFPFPPGEGVRAGDGAWSVADRGGFAFLACCRVHAGAGWWWGGRWPEPAELGSVTPAHGPQACGRLLTPREVAAAFGVSPLTPVRWAEAGRLTAYRTAGGHRRFDVAEVAALAPAAERAPRRARDETAQMAARVIRALLNGSEGLARSIARAHGGEALAAAAAAGEGLAALCREIGAPPAGAAPPAAAGPGEDQERHLRAWRLAGQPESPQPQEPPRPREEVVLAAHRAGALVLGGDFAAAVTRA
jgi:excisionase family DNA binding protein